MKKSLIAFVIIVFVLTACLPFSGGKQATAGAEAAFTQAAKTMWAQVTQAAGETAVAQLTQIAQQPSVTPLPATNTLPPPAPTAMPQPEIPPTPTAPAPTATAVPVPCDWVELVADITIPIDSPLPAGALFTKTWRIKNIGSCTWSTDYTLVFSAGDPMGDIHLYPMPAAVQPGVTIDLSATMIVPNNPAIYQGHWMLRNTSGALFGLGAARSDPLLVRVQSYRPPVVGDYPFNFALNFCAAKWQSASGRLTCPGVSGDASGGAILLDRPALEDVYEEGMVLWMRPHAVLNGWINGQFPAYTIRQNDHFLAQVGCLAESQGCDITFQVSFQTQGGASRNLGSWREVLDQSLTEIDVDLTPLTDIAGWFVFSVVNNGAPEAANAAWVEPRIENLSSASQRVLSWTRDDGGGACGQLEIHLTNGFTAGAIAYPCGQNPAELGRANLTQDEMRQLLDWYHRLGDFDGEIYQAVGDQPKIVWIYFQGEGSQNATNADIAALNSFAASLFYRILGRSR